MINTNKTSLAGVPTATLQAWLLSAQSALNDLMIGGKPVVVLYTQGDGQKSVTYQKTDVGQLTMWIRQLQIQLGIAPCGRRAFTPYFGNQ